MVRPRKVAWGGEAGSPLVVSARVMVSPAVARDLFALVDDKLLRLEDINMASDTNCTRYHVSMANWQ